MQTESVLAPSLDREKVLQRNYILISGIDFGTNIENKVKQLVGEFEFVSRVTDFVLQEHLGRKVRGFVLLVNQVEDRYISCDNGNVGAIGDWGAIWVCNLDFEINF